MNKLEIIGLQKLKNEVVSILKRSGDENTGRMEHEQIHIHGDAKRALEIIKALEENQSDN